MPDASGHDLARRIKRREPSAYIIMTTAKEEDEEISQAVENEADGFLVKPFDKKMIIDYINKFIETHTI